MAGRPYAEDPTSFNSTGIPRGDPRRYQSRSIIRVHKDRSVQYEDQRLEVPQESITTEGDRQLKQLLDKQLNTSVTLESELGKKKSFQSSSSYQGLEGRVAGKLTYEQYARLADEERYLEELKACGLTQEEIELKLHYKSDDHGKRRKVETTVLTERLADIDHRIEQKKAELARPDKFAGQKYLSRQEYELEQSISHDAEKAKLLACLMTTDKPDPANHDPHDPINNLDQIWANLRQQAHEEIRKKRKKRKNKKFQDEQATDEEVKNEDEKDAFTCPSGDCVSNAVDENLNEPADILPQTENNAANVTEISGETKKKRRRKKKNADKEETYTDDFIGPLPREAQKKAESSTGDAKKDESNEGEIEMVPEDAIVRYRLSLQQIRELERFKNYSPGQPSQVLYLKNLAPKVTQDDLISLFGRYGPEIDSQIDCKLLKGRMKGQAFVTFPGVKYAEETLKLINGYKFKGKPIIIEFGHQCKPSDSQTQD